MTLGFLKVFTYVSIAFTSSVITFAEILTFSTFNIVFTKTSTFLQIHPFGSLSNSSKVLFQCVTGSGTTPDNEIWVQRKRNAVLRFGCSTWMLHCKYGGDEGEFAKKMGMGPEQAGKYAIHGGGVPIMVQGVEGVVAVVAQVRGKAKGAPSGSREGAVQTPRIARRCKSHSSFTPCSAAQRENQLPAPHACAPSRSTLVPTHAPAIVY